VPAKLLVPEIRFDAGAELERAEAGGYVHVHVPRPNRAGKSHRAERLAAMVEERWPTIRTAVLAQSARRIVSFSQSSRTIWHDF
jgi:hypothetical protein